MINEKIKLRLTESGQVIEVVVVILGISILAFAILHVLGDPVLLLLPQNAGKEEFERYRHLLGLDRPLYVQYGKFLSKAVVGDFGKSGYADTPSGWSSSGCPRRST